MLLDAQGTLIPRNSALMTSGLDSISAAELKDSLASRFAIEIPQTLIFDHPTTEQVASFISCSKPHLSRH